MTMLYERDDKKKKKSAYYYIMRKREKLRNILQCLAVSENKTYLLAPSIHLPSEAGTFLL